MKNTSYFALLRELKDKLGLCLVLGFASPVSANAENVIVANCFRGPLQAVVWDRPKAVFVQSLVDLGLDITTATDIAAQVCRDSDLIGNPEAMTEKVKELVRAAR